ncbi:MAG: response regulator, partial [Anaerolineae bacterium]|nr:response regulator [Anaerolineae bacterium]
MTEQRDVILIVDDDAAARAYLRDEVLAFSTFQVAEASDGSSALTAVQQYRPDLILADLDLPELSGRDLLVALKSQGYQGPLILIVDKGKECSAVEAFRLGATDFVTRPIRDAELLNTVERGLAEVRVRRQRDDLARQVQASSQELERRSGHLAALVEVGQAVTTLRDPQAVFDRVLDAALVVTGADHAKLLLRDEKTGK